ncbi:MAG: prepilin-type N-terminal cleavage/methylation domain-containing protein [Lentisphaeria bacterium]|nr:prepilin-type N-terminal cleavage/methylation domain-containing protein [Lentisphaeria bacterium]
MCSTNKKVFTLIELLVVIAIIAITTRSSISVKHAHLVPDDGSIDNF